MRSTTSIAGGWRWAAITTAAALAMGLLAVPGAGAAVGRLEASGDFPLEPTPELQNAADARGKSGPALAVNPANANHIVETHQELVTEECEYNVSLDRGRTWQGGVLRAPAGYPDGNPGPCSVVGHGATNIAQQAVAFGSAPNVYAVFTSSQQAGQQGAGYTVLLAKSVDGGVSFAQAVEIPALVGGPAPAPNFVYPELVVERRTPATDRVYVTARDARTSRALVARSEDAGATWVDFDPGAAGVQAAEASDLEAPVPTWNAENTSVTAAGDAYKRATELTQPVLGPAPAGGGARPLYLAWRGAKVSGTCPPSCEAADETAADAYLVVAKSTDMGATWTRTRAANVRGFLSPTGQAFGTSNFPRLGVSGDNVYLVFNQGPGVPSSSNCGVGPFPAGAPGAGDTTTCPAYTGPGYSSSSFGKADHFMNWDLDVWFLRSTDGGATWRDLRQLNEPKKGDLAVAEITQTRHPQVSVAPDGRVDVVWHDRRHWYLTTATRALIAASTPGGTLADYPCVHTHANCDESRLGDTYYAVSTDGGASFSANRRVNDRSHNNDVGYDYRFSTYWDYGPASVPLGADELLVADMDSRLGNFDTDSQDIFLRVVDLDAGAGAIPVDDQSLGAGGAPALSVAASRLANPGGSEAELAATFATKAATRVVIVNEGDAAGALVGSVLARANVGPLLASPAGGLPDAVKAEVERMSPIGAYLIGDSGKLATAVRDDLVAAGVAGAAIQRIQGATPADVAAAAANLLDARSAEQKETLPAFDAAVIANPNSASASAASALAANRRLPFLFVNSDSIPSATTTALQQLGITRTLIVGSTGVISPSVESQLPNPTRLGGGDQFAASKAVVGESVARGLPKNIVYVGDGNEPMHGALLGAAVARLGGLLVLVPGGDAAAAETVIRDVGLRNEVDRLVVSDLTGTATAEPDPGDTTEEPPPPSVSSGYRMVAGDGGVFTFGDRRFHGSTGNLRLNKPIVGGATDPSDFDGYWLVASDGGVFTFGAGFHGSLGGTSLASPAVEIEPTPSGKGYWIVLADGAVHAFGDARHFGDFRGRHLNRPIIGMSVTPSGEGYWLVGQDGGIFTFGDAGFFGSTGNMRLNEPVIDLAPEVDGNGYYLVAKDGGVFTFGSAQFRGSTGNMRLNAPVIAMLVAPNGAGYWLGATDGGVFTFGAVPFHGSMGGTRLNSPVLDLID